MSIEIGSQAPEFTLYNTSKEAISLSSYKGKNVILLFFPFAFSSVCTAELCSLRDNLAVYDGLNAEVVGISVDSLFTLAKFKEAENLNFELLSDFNKDVSTLYGSLFDLFPAFEYQGVSKRAAFVIDASGKVLFAQVNDRPQDLPDFEQISKTLQSIE